MTLRNQNRIKQLEATTRPAPCQEIDYSHCTEAEIVAMRDLGEAARLHFWPLTQH